MTPKVDILCTACGAWGSFYDVEHAAAEGWAFPGKEQWCPGCFRKAAEAIARPQRGPSEVNRKAARAERKRLRKARRG